MRILGPDDHDLDGRIAVFGPHPDDFEVVAVTLRRAQAAGATIDLAVMTTGANGVDPVDYPGLDRSGRAALREEEQRASCAAFGLPPDRQHYLRLDDGPEGELTMNASSLMRIRSLLEGWRPQLVILPHPNDPNRAHQRTYAIVRQALASLESGARLLLSCDPKTTDLRVDLCVTFDERDADWKRALLRHHASQHRRNLRSRGHGLDDRILGMNAGEAARLGLSGYAETFEVRDVTADA